jgi:TolB-like protein/tetratricopeptide (TPR) repeat protein
MRVRIGAIRNGCQPLRHPRPFRPGGRCSTWSRVAAHLSGASQAVFISYASEDAEAAGRICQALRTAGFEVWFDRSELRGGDAWDQSIRKQIKTCTLFLPVISRNTHDRDEGYFRLEWKLAVDRCHLMAADKAFLLPVVIDETRDDDERVPERFREVQWTRLPSGVTPVAFVDRIRRLLSGELSQESARTPAEAAGVSDASQTRKSILASWRAKATLLVLTAVVVFGLGYLVANRFVPSKLGAEVAAADPGTASQAASASAFNPPPHSIAVLPFVNMSGDASQEYFSDGLTEEVLDSLSHINELQVAARTSAFSFKAKDTDIGVIARRLNVAAVLEGSVRRSGRTVRITAQLINAVTGFHVWSQTYDRDLGDVLKLQTEIATAVANALKVSLLRDVSENIEGGGTHNSAAFDAFLRGRKIGRTTPAHAAQDAISAYTEAIQLDPRYALAFAERSVEFSNYAYFDARGAAVHEAIDRALADARTALALAPALAEGHYASGVALRYALEFAPANEESRRALDLAPGSARMLVGYSRSAAEMGHASEAITAGRRAIILDPLNFQVYRSVGIALSLARQYPEAITAFKTSISLEPGFVRNHALLGEVYYAMSNLEAARRECEAAAADLAGQECLTKVYRKLGRHADAEAMLHRLASADDNAYEYARIYAQWGDKPKALQCLERAVRVRDPGLVHLKVEADLDPLRDEPRFQAIERDLKFPT